MLLFIFLSSISNLKSSISNLRFPIINFRWDISNIQSSISNLKSSISNLKSKIVPPPNTMITIPGYRIDRELYTNFHAAIYRGMQLEEQKTVILKTLTSPYPTPAQIAQLLHESEILKNLNLPGIFKLYKIEKYNHFPD